MSCNTHVLFNCQCTLCTFESHFPSLLISVSILTKIFYVYVTFEHVVSIERWTVILLTSAFSWGSFPLILSTPNSFYLSCISLLHFEYVKQISTQKHKLKSDWSPALAERILPSFVPLCVFKGGIWLHFSVCERSACSAACLRAAARLPNTVSERLLARSAHR